MKIQRFFRTKPTASEFRELRVLRLALRCGVAILLAADSLRLAWYGLGTVGGGLTTNPELGMGFKTLAMLWTGTQFLLAAFLMLGLFAPIVAVLLATANALAILWSGEPLNFEALRILQLRLIVEAVLLVQIAYGPGRVTIAERHEQ